MVGCLSLMDWVAYCQRRSPLNERTQARLTYDRSTLALPYSNCYASILIAIEP